MNILSFFKNKNESETELEFIITGTKRDYSSIVRYDVALKVWLPEGIDLALKEMSDFSNTPVSTILRQTLYTYLYGSYDQMYAIEKNRDNFISEGTSLASKPYSLSYIPDISSNRTPELGKNTYDVKLWIAKKMKEDLQKLADDTKIKLSVFIREILISKLFGHTYLSEREEMLSFRIEVDSE